MIAAHVDAAANGPAHMIRNLERIRDTGPEGGVAPLDHLGTLVFDGTDVAEFLQGYLTTDTVDLDVPRFTAICNIKGRVVCTGYVWHEDSKATMVLHRSLCPVVLDFLRPYVAFSRTTATQGAMRVLGAMGDVGSFGTEIDSERRVLLADEALADEVLRQSPRLEPSSWDRAAIARREVWLQDATSGAFLPQMIGLDQIGAVSFTKGCYLGQEIVARAQHRGQVKRRLDVLAWQGVQPSVGTSIRENGRQVGTLVAAAQVSEGAIAGGEALVVLQTGHEGPFTASESETTLTRGD